MPVPVLLDPLDRIRRMRNDLGTGLDRALTEEAREEVYRYAVFGESEEIRVEALRLLAVSFQALDSGESGIYVPATARVGGFALPLRQG